MPQTTLPQSATASTRRQTCHLALSDRERRDLVRLMYRVLDDIDADKNSYRVLALGDPARGRLVKDGEDITELTLLDEAAARRFLFLAQLK